MSSLPERPRLQRALNGLYPLPGERLLSRAQLDQVDRRLWTSRGAQRLKRALVAPMELSQQIQVTAHDDLTESVRR
ncbi:hypothetical protein L6R46_04290 [Myxococcota bacterium]|nr:hypothetical protein [Myxococcota bacterium]